MYAIFKIGSKQYKAKHDQIIRVEKLNYKLGEKIEINKVLMISTENEIEIGTPFLKKKIECKIIKHIRCKKIKITKFKRRKNSRKKSGHRQWVTTIKIKLKSTIHGE